MSEYERLCYAQTPRTEKQAIYFMLRPKYFASGLNFPVNRHYTPLHKWTELDVQLSKDKCDLAASGKASRSLCPK